MKFLLFIPLFLFSLNAFGEDRALHKNSNDYKYTSLGVHFIEAEDSGFAINLSINLLGPFYAVIERKADGVDYKNESYDKVVDSLRLGAHKGIGDLIGTISADRLSIKVKNIFDVFAEVGIKTSEFDGERFNFDGEDSHASFLAGIRFGNSYGWEGKIFIDASKEAVITDTGNPTCQGLICPPYDAQLSDDADNKFGIGILYNINKRGALIFEVTQSQVLENSFKIGYQLNW